MAKKGALIVGLDIGTTKIVTIVGEVNDAGGIDIVGVGQAPSRGLRKGVIVDIDSTVASIRQSVSEAENMAGCKVDSVFAGIAGGHIRAFNSHGVAAIKNKEVRTEDVARVLALARAAAIPQDREVLHILPRQYIVDGQEGIKSPNGIYGVRLEAHVHIVTAAAAAVQNVARCAELAGLKVADIVLEPLASAESVLTEEEKNLGVCLVDIGGGTTDIAVFGDGALVHTSVIPLGGNHLTNDIVVGLRTPINDAERIKRQYGCALSEMVAPDEMIDVPSVGDRGPRKMARRVLCDIIEPRMEEIFGLVAREIQGCGWEDKLTSGLVVTGGASLVPGLEEMAEDVLGLLVRRGEPRHVGGIVDSIKHPSFATGVGLALYGLKAEEQRFYLGRPQRGVIGKFQKWWGAAFG
jgi:cell division protein FtsA